MTTNFEEIDLYLPEPHDQQPDHEEDVRYHLTPENLSYLEDHLLMNFNDAYPAASGVVVFAVSPDNPYADIARTEETRAFHEYDSSVAMLPYEDSSIFVFTVNLDNEVAANDSHIAHLKRLVKAKGHDFETSKQVGTGLEVVDDRLFAESDDEKVTLEEIAQAHGISDFSRCINVTSNMAAEGVKPDRHNPYALISYKAVFEIGKRAEATHLFAYVNPSAIRSLEKLGVRCDLLAGKEFHLPDPEHPGEYDEDYVAVCLPYDEENMSAFTTLHKDFPMRRLIAERNVDIYEV